MLVRSSMAVVVGISLVLCPWRAGAADRGSSSVSTTPLFVLSNGVEDPAYPTPEAQATLLAQLGYSGIAPSGTQGVAEMLKALDAHHLKMAALYIGANLDVDQPKYDSRLNDAIATLAGRETVIWLYLTSQKYPSASAGGDDRAVAIVREVAEMASRSDLRVALYPHVGFYVARIEDAVRVADKVDRPNVGVTFNLCHWLKQDGPTGLEARLKLALPHLMLVTINGADTEGGWDRIIQTLDRGSYDVYGFLRALWKVGYRGPIGLQCYAIRGNKRDNLVRSMKAWQEYCRRLAADPN